MPNFLIASGPTECTSQPAKAAVPYLAVLAVVGSGRCATSNRDKDDVAVVLRGATVRLGASLGLVLRVSKGQALVRYASGAEQWDFCSRLEVVRHLGRVRVLP